MSKLHQYIIQEYQGNKLWFIEEVNSVLNRSRVNKVVSYKNYLNGMHSILGNGDIIFKNQKFVTSKTILQTMRTILTFKASFLMSNPVSLSTNPEDLTLFNRVYRAGGFHRSNYDIAYNVNAYGDAYEFIYYDAETKRTKSKLIDSADGHPIFNSKMEYIAFVEYYHDAISGVESYVIYSPSVIQVWDNTSGNLAIMQEYPNVSGGLPIHYINTNDLYGRSVIDDLKPIMDKLEILLNRLDDAVYTLSLNPLGCVSGSKLSDSADAEGIGFVLSLEDGAEFKWATANLDSASVKILFDQLLNQLFTIAQVPSHIMGNTSTISNVSQTSLSLLFSLSSNSAKELGVYLSAGFDERHAQIANILRMQGQSVRDEFIDVIYTFNSPVDKAEIASILSVQYQNGCLSKRSYLELSNTVSDAGLEMQRIQEEQQQKPDEQKPVDTRVSILEA